MKKSIIVRFTISGMRIKQFYFLAKNAALESYFSYTTIFFIFTNTLVTTNNKLMTI